MVRCGHELSEHAQPELYILVTSRASSVCTSCVLYVCPITLSFFVIDLRLYSGDSVTLGRIAVAE